MLFACKNSSFIFIDELLYIPSPFIYPFQRWWILVSFPIWTIANSTVMNIHMLGCSEHKYTFLLGLFVRVELLDQKAYSRSTLRWIVFRSGIIIHGSICNMQGHCMSSLTFNARTFLFCFVYCYFLMYYFLMCQLHSLILTFVCWMPNKIEHLLIHVLSILVSSLVILKFYISMFGRNKKNRK